jgi:hypothetical protein
MSDSQDGAEQVDEEVVADLDYPPDHPLGVDEVRGVDVDQDGSVRESLAERQDRLVPDDERPADPDDDLIDAGRPLSPTDEEVVPESAEEAAVHGRPDAG